MKLLITLPILLILSSNLFSQVRVTGYYKKNGTYVEPHYRSSPNKNPYDNYSFPDNYNPYSGKISSGDTDKYLENYNKKSTRSYITSSNYSYTNTKNNTNITSSNSKNINSNQGSSNTENVKINDDVFKNYLEGQKNKSKRMEEELDIKINQFKVLSKRKQ